MAADKRAAMEHLKGSHAVLDSLRQAGNPEPASGLSIVIPTYNALGTIEPLLSQLIALPEVQSGLYEVVITDDASTDGTVAVLRQHHPDFVFVESATNTGFGPNANRGLRAVTKEGYIAVVNTDVELCGNPFAELMAALHTHPDYFALMPLVFNTARQQVENLQRLEPSRGLVWNADLPEQASFTVPVRRNLGAGVSTVALLDGVPVAGIIDSILCGACFVCSWIRVVDGLRFNERLVPCYWEDVDLGYQANWRKLKTGVDSAALVIHRHSETINKIHGARKLHYLRLNQLRFTVSWQQRLGLVRPEGWWLLRGLREKAGGNPELATAYLREFWAAALRPVRHFIYYLKDKLWPW